MHVCRRGFTEALGKPHFQPLDHFQWNYLGRQSERVINALSTHTYRFNDLLLNDSENDLPVVTLILYLKCLQLNIFI